jgi:hypothetical protein
MMEGIPAICPWDTKYGEAFNVLKHGNIIFSLILAGRIVAAHFGIPCQTLTFARIPQLRNAQFVEGLPDLSMRNADLVKIGNQLVNFTVLACVALHSVGGYFSVENPLRSWLWKMHEIGELLSTEGVATVLVLFRNFGVPFHKPTLFLHNMPTLGRLQEPVCPWVGPTAVLRGLTEFKGALVFRTKLAEAYPPALGKRYAQLLSEALKVRSQALRDGEPVPHAPVLEDACLGNIFHQEGELEPDVTQEETPELVPKGLGARKGLGHLEHVAWADSVTHPSSLTPEKVTCELLDALKYESETDPDEIDAFRASLLYEFIYEAKNMQEQQHHWSAAAPKEISRGVKAIHGPLLGWALQKVTGSSDTFARLLKDCQQGFPFVEDLPPCEGSVSGVLPKSFPKENLGKTELRANRRSYNTTVLSKLTALPHSEDIMPQTIKDAEQGWMTHPRPLRDADLDSGNLTRRIPVREEREKGWRTRVVDHETESMINPATRPCDKVKHDDIGVLAFMVAFLLQQGILPKLWKRDISSAFRRVPIFAEHLEFTWVAWLHAGRTWISQHLGMPFGTVSAVYAWHRIGHALLLLVIALFRAPTARYVDDYFGTSRDGVQYSGGVCLTILARLIGFPTDDAKSADDMIRLVVLGASVIVDWPGKACRTHIADGKADKWGAILEKLLASGACSPMDSASMGGRLSFSVTTAGNRVGRAFIKPFYAQQFAPLKGDKIGEALEWAMRWFITYLALRPPAVLKSNEPRPLVVSWADAAGASRWVAAVIRVNNSFYWTRIQTPQHIWDQLAPRDDSQIGFQELLGVVLILGTFGAFLEGSLWVGFGDNDGVTYALAKGGGHSLECNLVIGKCWLQIAAFNTDLHAARVESHANIADGPTRDHFDCLTSLNAIYVEPKLPEWIHDVWHVQPLS